MWAPCGPHELCYLGSCFPCAASHGNNRIYSLSVYCLHRLDTSLWNPRETRKWVCSERMMHWIKKIHWFYCREQFSYLPWFHCLCLRQTSNAVSPGFYHKFQAHFLTNVKHSKHWIDDWRLVAWHGDVTLQETCIWSINICINGRIMQVSWFHCKDSYGWGVNILN